MFSFWGRGASERLNELPSSLWAQAQLSHQYQRGSFGYSHSLGQMLLQAKDQKMGNSSFLRRLRSIGHARRIKLSQCVVVRVVLNGNAGGFWSDWSWPDKWDTEL